MNESSTFEFVVAEKPEGKRKITVTLARIGIIAILVAFVGVCFAFNAPMFAIIPLSFMGVFMYFWKIFNRECEYSMTSGVMTFSYIYGGMRRKKILDLFIKDMREIAPMKDDSMAHINALGVEKDYRFVSSSAADDMYYAIFEQNGKLCVVYFEATAKALSILRYYNHQTVMTNVSR